MMPKIAANIISRLTSPLGYQVIPNWRLENYEMTEHLREIFRHLEINTVFDVGANRGQYKDFLRKNVGFPGQIVSFEPLEALATELAAKSALDPYWHIYPFALGSESTNKKINVMHDSKFSSFLEPDNEVIAQFKRRNTVSAQESVSLKRLDDIFEDINNAHKLQDIYLKLDTQGFDLEVIKGAKNSLQHIKAIQSEISFQPIYSGMPNFVETISEYAHLGFEIIGIFPVSRDESLRLIEADCVMINKHRP